MKTLIRSGTGFGGLFLDLRHHSSYLEHWIEDHHYKKYSSTTPQTRAVWVGVGSLNPFSRGSALGIMTLCLGAAPPECPSLFSVHFYVDYTKSVFNTVQQRVHLKVAEFIKGCQRSGRENSASVSAVLH